MRLLGGKYVAVLVEKRCLLWWERGLLSPVLALMVSESTSPFTSALAAVCQNTVSHCTPVPGSARCYGLAVVYRIVIWAAFWLHVGCIWVACGVWTAMKLGLHVASMSHVALASLDYPTTKPPDYTAPRTSQQKIPVELKPLQMPVSS